MEDAPMSDDFQPPEPSQTSAAWVRSVRAMEQGPGRDIVQWQSSPSAYAALESLKRRSEMAAPPPKPRVPLFAPQRRNSSAPSLVTAAANASFGLLPYDKRVAPSKARKMGPPKIVLPTASQNDFPHLGKIARSIMEDQQLLKRKRLEKQQQAKQGEPSCVKLKPKGKEKEKERETKGKGKERERIDLLPVARSCSDSMVDRTNIRPPSPSSPFYEGTTPRQADYRQAANEDEASMDTDMSPTIGTSVQQRPPLDAADFTFASDGFSHSTPPSRRLAKTRSIVMDDPEDEPRTPLAAPAQLKHPPPIGADTEPSMPQRTLSAHSRQAAPSRGIPNPTDTRSLSPEVPLMDEHEDEQDTEDEEDVPPRPPSPQPPTRLQAVRPAPKPKPKPATVAHQHHSQPHQLSRQPSQPRQEPPPPQHSRFPPPSQTPSPTQRAPPPLGMRRYGTVATSFRPSQELPTKRKGFKPPLMRGAPPPAADTKVAVNDASTAKVGVGAGRDVGRGGVKATDYAARVNLNVTSEPSSSFPARSHSPEVPLDADSSYGELSFDMDALEEVARQYD